MYSSLGQSLFKVNGGVSYEELDRVWKLAAFTYKSNEILHKISESYPKYYPYDLLLHIVKTYHFNQFEIIFLSHILSDVEPCIDSEPELFCEDIEINQSIYKTIDKIRRKGRKNYSGFSRENEQINVIIKGEELGQEFEENLQPNFAYQTEGYLKKIYIYLLVLGYAVKYYLNEQHNIKPYDEQIKQRHPTFFASIFNKWAKKYGNSVLATTPRKINSYYSKLSEQLQMQQVITNSEGLCQYRNYNEIVQELIKATTQGEDQLDKEDIL